ncbi:MAG: 4-(cytidine 5'-diphospho)-2-C-methyl-D-erythritol kinase [Planctomycetota bacterium]|nr:MAG: 4-(cytidine 5'-diphospho)-2-C-methyl-D-erythritol kinase [Planctomycetota bacterium]
MDQGRFTFAAARPADRAAPAALVVCAAAKLNLSLAVLERRPDGYHDIESLMVPVTLHDTLRVQRSTAPGIRLAVRFGGQLAGGPGRTLARDVPVDASNLVVRAAQMLADESGACGGLDVELVKEIPSGAGLGGGSSDAAAVLMAANRLWDLRWPASRLAALGARIGSDVPWFFAAGPAIAAGRGEVVTPVAELPPLAAVIACPATGLSTAAVYAACAPDARSRGAAARLAAALAAGDLRGGLPCMTNTLEPPARALCADVDALLVDMGRCGAFAPRLTGSGSACFTLARTMAEARGIAARLAALRGIGGPRWPGVFVVRLAGRAAPTRCQTRTGLARTTDD